MKRFKLHESAKIVTLIVVVGLLTGLLIMAQWRTKPTRALNPVAPYASLRDTREELTSEQKAFKSQIKELQDKITQAQENLKSGASSTKSLVEEVEALKKKVGLTDAEGPGIVIALDDSPTGPATIDSIAHAADLRDLVNFLLGAGAEAISINNERIVATSSIDCIVNTVLVNNSKLSTPFVITVIGDPQKLADEVNNEDNLKEMHKRVKNEGLRFEVMSVKKAVVPGSTSPFSTDHVQLT